MDLTFGTIYSCVSQKIFPKEYMGAKIMIVQRGLCTFDTKVGVAKKADALGLIIVDPDVRLLLDIKGSRKTDLLTQSFRKKL